MVNLAFYKLGGINLIQIRFSQEDMLAVHEFCHAKNKLIKKKKNALGDIISLNTKNKCILCTQF